MNLAVPEILGDYGPPEKGDSCSLHSESINIITIWSQYLTSVYMLHAIFIVDWQHFLNDCLNA